ncbi:MAG: DUF3842 family protein, partial [Spirochaetaceae bacterium]|nr:DUF3842 family protein [Spirochaetaceae bacterium]
KKRIVVIDGMGGGVGAQIIERLKALAGAEAEILALGANSGATDRMLKAGADRGASGENAIRVSAASGSLILGPIGIVLPNGMLGEITPAMAEAVLAAPCVRILVPVQQEHFILVGLEPKPLGKLIDEAAALAAERLAVL